MALTEVQQLIIDGLKLCGANKTETMIATLMLTTERKQWEMVAYLDSAVDTPPPIETILRNAQEIAQKA